MKIRFTQNHKVKQGDGKGAEYAAGETYTFNGIVAESYARKYVARGYAVDVTNEKPVKAAKAPDPPKVEDGKPQDPPKEPEKPQGFMSRLGGV